MAYVHQKTSFTLTDKCPCRSGFQCRICYFLHCFRASSAQYSSNQHLACHTWGRDTCIKVNDSRDDGLSSSWKGVCHRQNHRTSCTVCSGFGNSLGNHLGKARKKSPNLRSPCPPPVTLASEEKVAGEDKRVCLTFLCCYKSYLHNY